MTPIALACLLASPGSDITFGHVQPATPHTRYYLNPQETRPDAGDPTREMLAAAAERSGLDAWIRTVSSTNVAVGLVAIAREVDADLIVVGTTDRSRLTRALLGNPTTKTMASADCVVAVAPQGYADGAHEIRRIGVAYDGSAASESALALARQLSAETHAEVSAFAVVPGPHEGPSLRRHHMERAVLALKEANVHMAQQDNVESLIGVRRPRRAARRLQRQRRRAHRRFSRRRAGGAHAAPLDHRGADRRRCLPAAGGDQGCAIQAGDHATEQRFLRQRLLRHGPRRVRRRRA